MEDTLASPQAKAAVLVSSKPGCFIAGADIAWLDSAKDGDEVNIMLHCATATHSSCFLMFLA